MAACVVVNGAGALVLDGAGDVTTCPMVVLSGEERSELLSVAASRITSMADAQVIAGSLFLLLAVAYGIRMVRRSLDVGDAYTDEKF